MMASAPSACAQRGPLAEHRDREQHREQDAEVGERRHPRRAVERVRPRHRQLRARRRPGRCPAGTARPAATGCATPGSTAPPWSTSATSEKCSTTASPLSPGAQAPEQHHREGVEQGAECRDRRHADGALEARLQHQRHAGERDHHRQPHRARPRLTQERRAPAAPRRSAPWHPASPRRRGGCAGTSARRMCRAPRACRRWPGPRTPAGR